MFSAFFNENEGTVSKAISLSSFWRSRTTAEIVNGPASGEALQVAWGLNSKNQNDNLVTNPRVYYLNYLITFIFWWIIEKNLIFIQTPFFLWLDLCRDWTSGKFGLWTVIWKGKNRQGLIRPTWNLWKCLSVFRRISVTVGNGSSGGLSSTLNFCFIRKLVLGIWVRAAPNFTVLNRYYQKRFHPYEKSDKILDLKWVQKLLILLTFALSRYFNASDFLLRPFF